MLFFGKIKLVLEEESYKKNLFYKLLENSRTKNIFLSVLSGFACVDPNPYSESTDPDQTS